MTGSFCGCSCRDVFFALTSDSFLTYRGPRCARKHRDGIFSCLSHVSLNAVCIHGTLKVISLLACWSLQAPTSHHEPGLHSLHLHVLPTHGCALACLLLLQSQRHRVSLPCSDSAAGSLRRVATQRLAGFDFACLFCTSSAHHPDGGAAFWHQADHSRRMLLSVLHLFDFLTSGFVLIFCTRSLGACLRPLARSVGAALPTRETPLLLGWSLCSRPTSSHALACNVSADLLITMATFLSTKHRSPQQCFWHP